jgi:hypothetical protein
MSLRRTKRQEFKISKVGLRQSGKSERVVNRQAARTVAYQNGIDPQASIISGVSNLVGLASNPVSHLFNGGLKSFDSPFPTDSKSEEIAGYDKLNVGTYIPNQDSSIDFSGKTKWYLIGAVLLFFMFGKK